VNFYGNYGFVEPDNKVIAYAPNTILIQEEKAEAATIKPGMVCNEEARMTMMLLRVMVLRRHRLVLQVMSSLS